MEKRQVFSKSLKEDAIVLYKRFKDLEKVATHLNINKYKLEIFLIMKGLLKKPVYENKKIPTPAVKQERISKNEGCYGELCDFAEHLGLKTVADLITKFGSSYAMKLEFDKYKQKINKKKKNGKV